MTVCAASAIDTEIKIANLCARVRATTGRDREIILARIADQSVAFVDMNLPCNVFALFTCAGWEEDNLMVL